MMSAKTFAQTQAFAISSVGGILESKLKIKYDTADSRFRSVYYVADTITLEQAQSIFALNVIGRDTNKIFVKLSVKDFAMFLRNGKDTATYWAKGEMLTAEMKNALKSIKPETEIYFEYIHAMQGKLSAHATVIEYYVK